MECSTGADAGRAAIPDYRSRAFGVGGRYGGAVSSDGWPTGTVSFLFTDVEGSTRLWAADEEAMSQSLRLHDSVLRDAIETAGGHIFTTAGDSFAAAFSRASDAVRAATEAQAALGRAVWPGPALHVRMGIHMGEAEERNGDYFGTVVNTAARVEAAGHGGQVLITDPVSYTHLTLPTMSTTCWCGGGGGA